MAWKTTRKKTEGSWELMKMKHPLKPRRFSSFYTRDKKDYSGVSAAMDRDKIKK